LRKTLAAIEKARTPRAAPQSEQEDPISIEREDPELDLEAEGSRWKKVFSGPSIPEHRVVWSAGS